MASPERVMKVLKYGFVVSGLLLVAVAFKLPARTPRQIEPAFEATIVLLALSNVVVGFFVPRFIKPRSGVQQSTIVPALNQWVTRCVFSLACFESCLLFGLVLHFFGERMRIVGLLFAAGLMAMLIWNPDPAPDGGQRDIS